MEYKSFGNVIFTLLVYLLCGGTCFLWHHIKDVMILLKIDSYPFYTFVQTPFHEVSKKYKLQNTKLLNKKETFVFHGMLLLF